MVGIAGGASSVPHILTFKRALWLSCTALIMLVPTIASAQSQVPAQNQQLMPARTQSRASLLSAGSPTAVANQNETEASGVAVTPAPIAAQRNTRAIEDLSPLPEGYVLQDNEFAMPVDSEAITASIPENGPTGIAIGTFTLRPSISQGINVQRQSTGETSSTRSYSATTLNGTLESDWSRHALRVDTNGRFERNISGSTLEEKPQAGINANLRLDLSNEMTGRITAGYAFEKEDVDSPNALTDVISQGREHRATLGASIEREFGILRGLAGVDFTRTSYNDAKDTFGTSISLKDRNRNDINLRSRIGYALSPALIPFLEVSAGKTIYDERVDGAGYQRSSSSGAIRIGTQFDRGEKLSGEFALGYMARNYDDDRLKALGALSVDAAANWSPRRGTDVTLALRTSFDDYASGTSGGWTNYNLRSGLTHQIRSDLVARLGASAEFRKGQDIIEYNSNIGLTWSVNRYVDVTADVSYKFTPRYNSDDFIIGAGITLKR